MNNPNADALYFQRVMFYDSRKKFQTASHSNESRHEEPNQSIEYVGMHPPVFNGKMKRACCDMRGLTELHVNNYTNKRVWHSYRSDPARSPLRHQCSNGDEDFLPCNTVILVYTYAYYTIAYYMYYTACECRASVAYTPRTVPMHW